MLTPGPSVANLTVSLNAQRALAPVQIYLACRMNVLHKNARTTEKISVTQVSGILFHMYKVQEGKKEIKKSAHL